METVQYWKPGETKPRDDDGGSGPPDRKESGNSSAGDEGEKGDRRGDGAEQQRSNGSNGKRGGGAGKRRKKANDRYAEGSTIGGGGIDADVSRSAAKPPVSGPSQGLLAMKFMQRKAKTDDAEKQQRDKRDKLERDFSSSYAKRLKAANTKTDDEDRLVCRLDEQDPALVVLGRRSFAGFNVVAEAAYDACVRDIAAGERLGQRGREDRGGGISDTEMAETLGKNAHGGGRR